MIEVTRYQPSCFDHLKVLLESQSYDYSKVDPESIPELGYVACEGSTVVAMGFLRRIEGGLAMLDGLCTNANTSSELRNSAINQVVEKLISTAKELELKAIIATTTDYYIIKRALSFDFKECPHKVISLALS